ncbi:MAG: DUF4058 family protein [Anaerolineae bacterium]|nr:DUF4058 family protein [Anaerolineae bacterium]
MPSPFPGMDPYLEDPVLWPDVHHGLIEGIRTELTPLLTPHFYVRVEHRVYITAPGEDPGYTVLVPDVGITRTMLESWAPTGWSGRPAITAPSVVEAMIDPEVRDAYLEIRDARSHRVVTAIEVLSPANKVKGSRGQQTMAEKRRLLLQGGASWLEIDLLRGGERLEAVAGRSDYVVVLYRPEQRGLLVWFIDLRDRLPVMAVPLRPPFPDVPLDLQKVLDEVYERACYADQVDYTGSVPPPPLKPADAQWVQAQIQRWRAERTAHFQSSS